MDGKEFVVEAKREEIQFAREVDIKQIDGCLYHSKSDTERSMAGYKRATGLSLSFFPVYSYEDVECSDLDAFVSSLNKLCADYVTWFFPSARRKAVASGKKFYPGIVMASRIISP